MGLPLNCHYDSHKNKHTNKENYTKFDTRQEILVGDEQTVKISKQHPAAKATNKA